jgi:histidine triad (HIT) family protein
MASIFTKIIQGEIPCYKIAEDEHFLAFLDVFPLVMGHVLVVPKVECDKFYECNDEILAKWLVFAKPIALAIEKAIPCKRVGMSLIGLEVPHAHMHLVPIETSNDLNFTQKKLSPEAEDLKRIQALILSHLL